MAFVDSQYFLYASSITSVFFVSAALVVCVIGMPHVRRLAGYVMGTLVASSAAFRPPVRQISRFSANRVASRWCRLSSRQQPCCPAQMQPPSMLLGVDAGLGIVGLSAISALSFVTENIAPKRVVSTRAKDRFALPAVVQVSSCSYANILVSLCSCVLPSSLFFALALPPSFVGRLLSPLTPDSALGCTFHRPHAHRL